MTTRVRLTHAGVLLGVLLLGVLTGLLVARGHSAQLLALFALATIAVIALIGEVLLLVIITIAALLQPPLGELGPIQSVELAEVLVPGLLIAVSLRYAAVFTAAAATRLRRDGGRQINIALGVFTAVLLANAVRSTWFLEAGNVMRPFYAYFVAIGIYVIVYVLLVTHRLPLDALLNSIFLLSAVVCGIGVTAVLLHLPLNFGTLRYSVYDYSSGAVRVGFLETFGLAGLALVCVNAVRFRVASGLLFSAAIIASGGRAIAAGLVVGILAYLVITRNWRPLFVTAALALILPFALPALERQAQVQRLTDINGRAFASDARAYYYGESIREFERHPVFGTGVGVRAIVPSADPLVQSFYEQQLQYGGHATYHSLLKNFGLSGFVPFVVALLLALGWLARLVRRVQAAGFFFIVLTAMSVSLYAGGNGSDTTYYFALGGAAALITLTARGERRVLAETDPLAMRVLSRQHTRQTAGRARAATQM